MKNLITQLSDRLFHHASWGGYWEPIIQIFKPAWRHGYTRGQILSNRSLLTNVVELTIQPDISWRGFTPGQHLVLTLEIDGRLMSRTFTIASGIEQWQQQGTISLVIKQYDNGDFTPHLSKLSQGDWINLSQAQGTFGQPNTHSTPLLMVAGGSGITPFLSMLATPPTQAVHLLYFAKPGQHIAVNELTKLGRENPLFSVEFITRTTANQLTEELTKRHPNFVMVCGPHSLFDEAQTWCVSNKVAFDAEQFGPAPQSQHEGEIAEHTVAWNDQAFRLNNQETLLAQLRAQGQSVTYGCGMGICHQCQCVKKAGIVRDIRTGRLSSSTEQLIQLCVSQVVTDLELEL